MAGVVGTGVFAENIRDGVKDADADGLSDHAEKLVGLDPPNADSDDDGLSDSAEAALGTDPLLADTDHDGLTDELEVEYGSDPLGSFVDSTGRMVKTAPWTLEAAYARRGCRAEHGHQPETRPGGAGTAAAGSGPVRDRRGPAARPASAVDRGRSRSTPTPTATASPMRSRSWPGPRSTVADSDADGLSDGYEALKSRTDPLAADTDSDQLTDAQEVAHRGRRGHIPGWPASSASGALAENVRDGVKDADSDGLSDRAEKLVGTDAKKADTDGDKLSDAMEIAFGTNPLLADTDRDGISDAIEVQYGLDPLAPGSALGAERPGGRGGRSGGWSAAAGAQPADAGGVFDPT